MMQKMVSLSSEQPEGSLFLAPALPSLCIRKEHMQKLLLLLMGSLQKDYSLMLLIHRCHGEPPTLG